MRRLFCFTLTLLASAGLLTAAAQAQTLDEDANCRTVYISLMDQARLDSLDASRIPPRRTCLFLAGAIQLKFDENRYLGHLARDLINARDLQSNETQTAGQAGAPSQGEAVPSIEPFALAGGSASAVGSEAGANAITALTINPSVFFLSGNDPQATAGWGRFTDLTVLFPVNNTDENNDLNIDYFGVRARVNITGFDQGNALYTRLIEEYKKVLKGASTEIQLILNALIPTASDTASLEACAKALLDLVGNFSVEEATVCDTEASLLLARDGRYGALRKALADARGEADKRFFGLDLRTDIGDPTLGAVDSSAGTYFFGGVAGGLRFPGKDKTSTSGVRARLGVQFIDLDDFDDSLFLVDGGVGFELTRPFAFQQLSLSGGFEFRAGGKEQLARHVQTDYVCFRGTLSVPLSNAYSVTLNVGVPVAGDIEPVISISANWSLLWPDSPLSLLAPD